MPKTQSYGIKFPINVDTDNRKLFDLNKTRAERVNSEIMHLIFTPKGQRLRSPDFGTRLIQYIFNPSDTQTWDDIVYEIKECVKMWINGCNVNDVELKEIDNGLGLAVKIVYSLLNEDGSSNSYELITMV